MPRSLVVRRLGLVDYDEAVKLQGSLVEQRRTNQIGDQLLLLQHPHVITRGAKARGKAVHITASDETLAARGVAVIDSGRGGDVTYHGPGQSIGYPILDLKPDRCDVHRYVRDLEEVMIRTARAFHVTAGRVPGLTGVWVGDDKLGAIGVRVSRWITSHGFALNVRTDLDYFSLIVPCGIADRGVTSLERASGSAPDHDAVEWALTRAFADVFECEIALEADR